MMLARIDGFGRQWVCQPERASGQGQQQAADKQPKWMKSMPF
jgi:hypothetical protein